MRTRKRRKRQLRGKARLISASVICDNEKCVEIDEFEITGDTLNTAPENATVLNDSCCNKPDCQAVRIEQEADFHALNVNRLEEREGLRVEKPISRRQQEFVEMFPEEVPVEECAPEVPKKIGFFGFIKKLFGF